MAGGINFYISLPETPVYLKPWFSKAANVLEAGQKTGLATAHFTKLYIIDPPHCKEPAVDLLEDSRFYVRSCLSTQSLYRNLVEQEELSQFEFVLGAKTFQQKMGRQLYALKLKADDVSNEADFSTAADRLICSRAQKQEYTAWVYEKDTETAEPFVLWRLSDCQRESSEDCQSKQKVMPDVLMECVENPKISPIFKENRFSPVYHHYKRAMDVLNMYRESREVQELLQIAEHKLGDGKTVDELQSMMKEPLIVVEGMDATGKTTLTQILEEKLNAARYSTPPPCLLPLRKFFDKLPEIVRRAYYSLGNYLVAQEIAAECQTRPVIMDRFWHSTTAYSIAQETSLEDLPPLGHGDYCWPSDLLKPTVVIFLTVSEEVRRQRLGNRHVDDITFEERSLNKDKLFRKRLCEAYLRMREPACIQVDVSGSKEEVVKAVLKQIELQGIVL
ncbi:hypothetical protein ACOMHN_001133 [Nucella lapillus]